MTAIAPIEHDVPVGPRTSFGVGGVAQRFTEPRSLDDFVLKVRECRSAGEPVFFLGGGTNTLFRDEPFPGLVIATGALRGYDVDPARRQMIFETGVPLTQVIRTANRYGLAGLENFIGIPGTVGGAVYGNAGGCGVGIGERLHSVEVIGLDGQLEWLERDAIDWRYRSSGLGERVITRVRFDLPSKSVEDVKGRTREVLRRKRETQPLSARSAGCVFRNPEGDSAGRLIEAAGLKGERLGGARVSPVHANFVVNEEGASSRDVSALIDRISEVIRSQFGVELEREIVTPGASGRSGREPRGRR